jgi:hypothetical protein
LSGARRRRRGWPGLLALLAALPAPGLAAPGSASTHRARAQPAIVTEPATPAARRMAAWATANDDTRGRPFIIVDKLAARVFAFDGRGIPIGSAPALLGLARGDDNSPGIGSLPLAQIEPAQRVTPAGRYEAHLGANISGHRILWVDYDAAISLHPVVTGNAAERRLQRLATASILDNRISYGCINVPPRFYDQVVAPLFAPAGGIVYILPETRPLDTLLQPPG